MTAREVRDSLGVNSMSETALSCRVTRVSDALAVRLANVIGLEHHAERTKRGRTKAAQPPSEQ
ncbi:MAG TPA: hypothetical protein VER96_29745 [Polyangiaceae bacterium]|nr:hypothetical protein [Polyangiaceae bacterium]